MVTFKENDKYLIISVDDKLDSLNAKEIYGSIEEKMKNSRKDIVFDFKNLEYISSAGLQILISCAKDRQAISKKVFIYSPNEMIDNIIKVTGFYSFLEKTENI